MRCADIAVRNELSSVIVWLHLCRPRCRRTSWLEWIASTLTEGFPVMWVASVSWLLMRESTLELVLHLCYFVLCDVLLKWLLENLHSFFFLTLRLETRWADWSQSINLVIVIIGCQTLFILVQLLLKGIMVMTLLQPDQLVSILLSLLIAGSIDKVGQLRRGLISRHFLISWLTATSVEFRFELDALFPFNEILLCFRKILITVLSHCRGLDTNLTPL